MRKRTGNIAHRESHIFLDRCMAEEAMLVLIRSLCLRCQPNPFHARSNHAQGRACDRWRQRSTMSAEGLVDTHREHAIRAEGATTPSGVVISIKAFWYLLYHISLTLRIEGDDHS